MRSWKAVEDAMGDQVRATLTPYLEVLSEVNPSGHSYLTQNLKAPGSEWIVAFKGPTRFVWTGKRWPATINAEIEKILVGICHLQEVAFRNFRGIY